MKLNKAFSTRVKELLKQKNIKQYELAQSAGLYHSTLTDILNCKYESASFINMVLIIKNLGISIPEFFSCPQYDFNNLDVPEK